MVTRLNVDEFMNTVIMMTFFIIVAKMVVEQVEAMPWRPRPTRVPLIRLPLALPAPTQVFPAHEKGEALMDQGLYEEVCRELEHEIAPSFNLREEEIDLMKTQARHILDLSRTHMNLEATNIVTEMMAPLWESYKDMKKHLSAYEHRWVGHYIQELRAKLFALSAGRAIKVRKPSRE